MTDPVLLIGDVTAPMRTRLGEHFELHFREEIEDLTAWLADTGPHVRQVLTNGHYGVPPEILDHLPNLKMVSCYGVGYDNIDTTTCVSRGIVVSHTPDVLNAEVATTAIMLMMACYREILHDDAWARSGDWARKGNAPLTRSVDNQTIGILGMGRIGQEIARKLAPWNPEILYHTRTPKDVSFEHVPDLIEMARRSDTLIVITPGGAATRHLVDALVLDALGPKGTLINVSRGTVVDEEALIAAMKAGRLGWAGLDVFEDEPNIPPALAAMSNTVLLPHVGSGTIETRAAMGNLAVENLVQFQKDGTVVTPVPECR
ncbi:MAG: 2-hydroxyacid dehydrogenase [Paracoccaceae bacterium]